MKPISLAVCAAIFLISCNNDKPTTEVKVAGATTTAPAPEPMPDSATMMKNWMDYATPGAEHKMILGGRYQQSVNKGNFQGMPFEGISTLCYDNGKKNWTSTWIDNMGTGMMIMEGSWDAATKTMTMKGKCFDPGVMKEKECRETFTMVDNDHQLMQMYETTPDGKERKTMQIHYTRKK